jgi:hypothetical protein
MPKSDQVLLRVGREISGDVYQIAWPATVQSTEGQWLWVVDNGGYQVPAVSGWVSKDEVLRLEEAHAHYTETLRTFDAPWVHWMVGICLEERKESNAAQEAYSKSLGVARDDAQAVRTAVEANANHLDAAIRLQRLKAAQAKSADEAKAAAGRLQSLAAEGNGIRRLQALFERAEALRRAFRLQLNEEGKKLRGTELIARAESEKEGGTKEDRDLFKNADGIYQPAAPIDPSYTRVGSHRWKCCLGRAELHLNRVAFLNEEAWSLIGVDDSPEMFSAAGTSADRLGTTTMPIDLAKLDGFCKSCQTPAQARRAHAVCVCLAVEIQLLQQAVKCFDEAVELNPDLVEAYRDRALAYLALARCEATLAEIETAKEIEKVLPGLRKEFANLDLQRAWLPQKLDRSLVVGQRNFGDALKKLKDAKTEQVLVATKKLDIANATEQMAVDCVTAAMQQGHSGARERKRGEPATQPKSSLATVWEHIEQLRKDAAEIRRHLDQDEKRAGEDLAKANAALNESYTMLGNSERLRLAEQSARTACEKTNFASAQSARVLAEIFASQCNFDRAQYYQKLAVVFASEDERPLLLETYRKYRSADAAVNETAKPTTPPSAKGPGKGRKQSEPGQSEEDSEDSSE